MKILFIGNSFSVDANEYLYKIAQADGFPLTALNICIGGCSLQRHAKNVEENLKEYHVIYNGIETEFSCTMLEALCYTDWDYVSLQQASHDSGFYDTYYPYINTVLDLIKSECPKAKILLHETWAYEKDSTHDAFSKYNSSQEKMHNALKETYERVAKEIGAEMIIPCGDVIAKLREYDMFNVEKGGHSLARDGFHMGYVYGRYVVAATWYQKMGMGDIAVNTFVPGVGTDMEKINLIKKTVKEICK